MKYIVFLVPGKLPRLAPVVFPNWLTHSDVAQALLQSGKMPELTGAVADSAGEYSPLGGVCSGHSETLGLQSKPDRDTRLLLMNDYGVDFALAEDGNQP